MHLLTIVTSQNSIKCTSNRCLFRTKMPLGLLTAFLKKSRPSAKTGTSQPKCEKSQQPPCSSPSMHGTCLRKRLRIGSRSGQH
ncbi:hypothetical protein Y032_0186g1055 [Ancylostoma ceylanicum]|uniref:Uncharacterized protein n=1 Tax=Ancylostoma ceylanicum TaxID=53326 RepID=A0A016SQW7_9BILA|nr:hypothetical protein Y032_0186g1055 [Ancylostoma ceylanicum]